MLYTYLTICAIALIFYVFIPLGESIRIQRKWKQFRIRLQDSEGYNGTVDAYEIRGEKKFIWIRTDTGLSSIQTTSTLAYVLSDKIETISWKEITLLDTGLPVFVQKSTPTLIIFDIRKTDRGTAPFCKNSDDISPVKAAAKLSFFSKTAQTSILFWMSLGLGICIECILLIYQLQNYGNYQSVILSLVGLCAIALPFTPPGLLGTLFYRKYKKKLQTEQAYAYEHNEETEMFKKHTGKQKIVLYAIFGSGILANAVLATVFLQIVFFSN